MRKINGRVLTVLAMSLGVIGLAQAETRAPEIKNTGMAAGAIPVNRIAEEINPDGAIKVGGAFLYPMLKLGAGYNDNVTGEETNAQSSSVVIVNPSMTLEHTQGGDTYQLGYAGAFTRYQDSSADNYNQHEFQALGNHFYGERAESRLKAVALWTADPRGSTDRGISPEVDRFRSYSINGVLAYGLKTSTGRIEAEAGYRNKRYLNNEIFTAASDLDAIDLAGRFYYRVAPKTRSFLELRNTDLDYKLASSIQDGAERRVMLGLDWEATAASTGVFKVGMLNKTFDNAVTDDFTGLSWEGALIWEPTSYTEIEMQTARLTTDSSGVGDYIVSALGGVDWTHKWSGQISHKLGYEYLRSSYHGAARKDTIQTIKAGLAYEFRRWMTVSADYSHGRRDSNAPGYDYSKNVIMLNAQIGL